MPHPDRWQRAGEKTDRIWIGNCCPLNKPVHQCLGYAGDDEETDTGTDTPFCYYFIHEEDEETSDTDLDEDDERYSKEVATKELLGDHRVGLNEASYKVRGSFNDNHDHDKDLLKTHVHDLSACLACINVEDICSFEQLEHDGCCNDWSDTQLND